MRISDWSSDVCSSEVLAEMYLAGILAQDGTIDGAAAARSPRVQADGRTFSYLLHQGEQEIRIVQNDVRAIQLGKAALYAGIRLLMDRLGIEQVEQIMRSEEHTSELQSLMRI